MLCPLGGCANSHGHHSVLASTFYHVLDIYFRLSHNTCLQKSSARKVPDPLRVFPYYSAIGLNADQDGAFVVEAGANTPILINITDSSPTATIGAYATPSRFSEVRANERESTQLFPGSKGSPMIGSYYTGTSYSPPV
jgi:hypothetical protein